MSLAGVQRLPGRPLDSPRQQYPNRTVLSDYAETIRVCGVSRDSVLRLEAKPGAISQYPGARKGVDSEPRKT